MKMAFVRVAGIGLALVCSFAMVACGSSKSRQSTVSNSPGSSEPAERTNPEFEEAFARAQAGETQRPKAAGPDGGWRYFKRDASGSSGASLEATIEASSTSPCKGSLELNHKPSGPGMTLRLKPMDGSNCFSFKDDWYNCSSCDLRVQFDGEPEDTFRGQDVVISGIYFEDPKALLSKLAKAKRFRVEVPVVKRDDKVAASDKAERQGLNVEQTRQALAAIKGKKIWMEFNVGGLDLKYLGL